MRLSDPRIRSPQLRIPVAVSGSRPRRLHVAHIASRQEVTRGRSIQRDSAPKNIFPGTPATKLHRGCQSALSKPLAHCRVQHAHSPASPNQSPSSSCVSRGFPTPSCSPAGGSPPSSRGLFENTSSGVRLRVKENNSLTCRSRIVAQRVQPKLPARQLRQSFCRPGSSELTEAHHIVRRFLEKVSLPPGQIGGAFNRCCRLLPDPESEH